MSGTNQEINNKFNEGGAHTNMATDIPYASSCDIMEYATVKNVYEEWCFEVETMDGTNIFIYDSLVKVIKDDFVLIHLVGYYFQIIYKYTKNQKIQLENKGEL